MNINWKSRCRPHAVLAVAAAVGALLVSAQGVQAQTRSVAEVANYKGDDRQQVLEAGARQEGKLTLYTTGTQIEPLLTRYKEMYPFVRLEVYRASSSDVARRLIEEYNAGYNEADGLELTAESLIALRDAGILQPYATPNMAKFDPEAIEGGRHWISVRESYGGIGYNTQLIPPDKAPKTWEDLLKPEFKGKMAISSSTTTIANWTGVLVVTYGEDFVRKLGAQKIRTHSGSSRAVANLLVSGEEALIARASNAHIAESKAKGAPVEWIAPGPVAVTDTGAAITSKSKNPHAMMLLIDFFTSTEGQKMYTELGYDSAHVDHQRADSPKQKVYLGSRPNYQQEFEQWVALFREAFQ